MRNHNTFFFLVVFHVSLLVGRHLCSSDNYQVRFLFILKTKQKRITFELDRLTAEGKPDGRNEWIIHRRRKGLAGRPETLLSLDLQKDPTPKEKKTNNGVRVNFCVCDPLVWDTHMRPLKHKSSFGKEAKVEKEQEEREERRNTRILWRGARGGGQGAEGRAAAHVPERRPFTGAGGEGRKDWLSGLWAVSPAAGWLLAIQSLMPG